MLGNYPPGRYLPKFVKKYGDVWSEAERAIKQYRDEVKDRSYPSKEFTYEVKNEVVETFREMVAKKFGQQEGHARDDQG
jgi:3-methyl-2-oxobutanoate hydroxymethyltransferase